jgi:hypothetical protein
MKKIVLLASLILSTTACKAPLEQKQAACRTMFVAYCQKGEECTGQPAAECLQAVQNEGLCAQEIRSSVADIQTCERDLATATCDSPPESCMTLE